MGREAGLCIMVIMPKFVTINNDNMGVASVRTTTKLFFIITKYKLEVVPDTD